MEQSGTCLPAGRARVAHSRNINTMINKTYYVYVLGSCKNNRLYIGITNNPQRRLKEHNYGNNKSSKGYLPYKMLYCVEASDRIEARILEKKFKTGYWREKFYKMNLCGVEQSGSSRGS